MTTLNLTKKYSGSYYAESETHIVKIMANYVSGITDGGWSLSIEEKTHIAKDFDGNEVQMAEALFYYPCDNKKQAVELGVRWILKNL